MNTGLKLKIKRMEKGLNQQQLGKAIGVSRQSVSLYERNKMYPNIKIIKKICRTLDTDPKELFFNEDEEG
ncbi:helix-turn-helix transcriptional regulator [Clostridium tyrobutyricum]|uniref:helix-turn-helix transcriptional regulator n=1 Tax=Clostridium tyrobutyricum TaxID=1519 RepID=UPI00057DF178|nr:helix-turn-helix transcriptional regulator [Clostridium tyrobutyricum]